MANKAKRLIEKVLATARVPQPARLIETDKKRGYRVVAISLYTPEIDWVNNITRTLIAAGSIKANRSLVVQEAIHRLQEDLTGKNPNEVIKYFIARAAKRTIAL